MEEGIKNHFTLGQGVVTMKFIVRALEPCLKAVPLKIV